MPLMPILIPLFVFSSSIFFLRYSRRTTSGRASEHGKRSIETDDRVIIDRLEGWDDRKSAGAKDVPASSSLRVVHGRRPGGGGDDDGTVVFNEAEEFGKEPVALTGSAKLMQNMRKSSANTATMSAVKASSGNGRDELIKRKEDVSAALNGEANEGDEKNGGDDLGKTVAVNEQEVAVISILYGGEAAREVAKDVKEAIEKAINANKSSGDDELKEFCKAETHSMEDFKKFCVVKKKPTNDAIRGSVTTMKTRRVIFVVETIENAQPAEEAGACIRYFNKLRKNLTSGSGDEEKPFNTTMNSNEEGEFQFAVMGLGDTNLLLDRQTTTAKDCNQAAQTLDNALAALGAHRLCEKGIANDAVGLEEGVAPWLEQNLVPNMIESLKAEKTRIKNAKPIDVLFAYGSQTGNAAEICKNLAAQAGEKYKSNKMVHIECFACNELDAETSLKPGTVVLFCVSSTGDGDAPDNCDMFLTRLKRKTKKSTANEPVLAGTQYAVLGLGDQNYSAFMAIPRMFSTIMDKGGAKVFKKRLEADDTLGLYEQVDAWVDTMWTDLDKAITRAKGARESPQDFVNSETLIGDTYGNDDMNKSAVAVAKKVEEEVKITTTKKIEYKGIPALQPKRVRITFSNNKSSDAVTDEAKNGKEVVATRDSPFYAKIATRKVLTNTDNETDRRVIHLEFDCENKNDSLENYEPGDSIAVLPKNDSALVSKLLIRLGVSDEERTFDIDWVENMAPPGGASTKPLPYVKTPCTVRDALERYIDITSIPRKSFLRSLAEECSNETEKDHLLFLSSRDGKERFETEISDERATLLTILESFPSCSISFEKLLDISSPLLPRLYSITSCKDAQKNPSVAFSVVRFEAIKSKELRLGVATNWLDTLPVESTRIPIYKVASKTFRLPEDVSKPIIMIGPGTGVAPFRGFLQKREFLQQKSSEENQSIEFGKTMLFFGCRRKEEDYLYEHDFNAFVESNALTTLVLAFSREQKDKKVYVQHKLLEYAETVRELILKKGAYVFVCGDGAYMAKDVHDALLKILKERDEDINDEDTTTTTTTKEVEYLREMTKTGRYVRDIWS